MKKLPFTDQKLILLAIAEKKIRTKSRNSTITLEMLDDYVSVYNGSFYRSFRISENMIGHKLGEFCFTKKLGKSTRFCKK